MARQQRHLRVKIRGAMAGAGVFRRFGPYVLLRTSGAGGMGRIELALRAQPGGAAKLSVLKRMHAELRSKEQDARFRREADIALQLSHGAIAQTIGFEQIDGELVLLQELVHGVDLRLLAARLASARERVPLTVAVHVVSEVARALAYAHAFGDRGIVHRDVTPDNIMLAFSGEVKLIDFGLARSNVDAALTSAGHIVGRPVYTAPEIWDGTPADRRADIYSLGVVLWQLLTGRRFAETGAGRDSDPPPPSTYNPALPAALDAIARRALARDPRLRFQNAGELQEALRPYLPADSLPEPALAELLARHFDVARERQMLAEEVDRTKRLLDSLGSSATATPTPAAPPRDRGPIITVAVAAAAGIAVAVLWANRGGQVRPTRAATQPQPALAALPPRPVSVDEPPPAPPAAASAGAPASTAAPHVHPVALSAGRARPPATKAPRPAPALSPDELLKRAQEKFDVGQTDAALALARQAASAGAQAPAQILMGKVLMSERRLDEAEHAFAEAARLDPADARAARLLALVRETRSGQR
jgi:serine/threonine protein kinase